jgi:N6-adenosine-specific RNA methylase IME4
LFDNRVGYWAERIKAEWRESVDGILAAGQSLIEACKELQNDRGALSRLLGRDDHPQVLPFDYTVAYRLTKIAQSKRIVAYTQQLPPSWETLALITRLTDEQFDELLAAGEIHPGMKQGGIRKFLRLARIEEDEARVLKLVPITGKFRTLVLDPAWEYDWLSIAGRAKPGYAMQTIEQLQALDIKQWADEETGCHLYCWVTNNFMAEACKLVAHWGFQHRTVITWIKTGAFGLGSYFRNSTEHVLFATLGETTTRHAAASIPTHFEADRGEHSEKPERFYEIVRASSYPPYGEGNQRQARPDFTDLFFTIDGSTGEIMANEAAE